MHLNAAIAAGLEEVRKKPQVEVVPSTAEEPKKRIGEAMEEVFSKLKEAKNRKEKRRILKEFNTS